MVEFRHNRQTGEYAVMEINGRFWGSLPLAVRAGIDFPYLQWQVAHGAVGEVPKTYRIGLRMRWTAGEIARLIEIATSSSTRRRLGYRWFTPIVQAARSFDPRTTSALFSIRDPIPELRDASTATIRTVLSRVWHLVAKILPTALVRRVAQVRLLDPPYRKTYLSRWLTNSLKLRARPRNGRLSATRNVTLVCRANRIRSPLAAAMLSSEVNLPGNDRFQIQSAGTRAVPGSSFDPRAQAAADAMGLTLPGRPQTVTPQLVEASELIVVMDRIVEAEMLTQFPRAAEKIVLLGEIAPGTTSSGNEIPDPDKETQSEFERIVSGLSASIHQLAGLVSQSVPQESRR